jgi:hypothetical protein
MTSDHDNEAGPRRDKAPPGKDASKREPGWASGLKQLYDSVVDEDLPDTFRDLLSQLDKDEKG